MSSGRNDKYMDHNAGKGKGKYVPPTKEQSDEIRDILKKNLPKASIRPKPHDQSVNV